MPGGVDFQGPSGQNMQASPPHGGASVVSAADETPTKMRGPHPLIHQSSLLQAGNKLRRKKSDVAIRPPPPPAMSGGCDESVRGSDSGRGGGGYNDASVTDDGSVNMRLTRLNTRSSRLIGTIMVWLKNINKMRTIQVCKAFYGWKFYQPPSHVSLSTPRHQFQRSPGQHNVNLLGSPGASVAGDVPPSPSSEDGEGDGSHASNAVPFQQHSHHTQHQSSLPPTSSLTEHKQSYLLLFTENEKLREQVHDIRKYSQKVEKNIRSNATRSIMQTFLRKWAATRIRYYFDIWFNNGRMLKLISSTAHKTIELQVGLQQVESEREYVRKTEQSNTSLRMLLCLTIYFFKWKSKIANRILHEERKQYEDQRRTIFKELRKMRELVSYANEQEVAVLHSAMMRGQDATQHLISVKEKLASIVTQSKNYRSMQITPETLSNLLASLSSEDGHHGHGSVTGSTSGKHRSRDRDRGDRDDGNATNRGNNQNGNNGNGGGNGKNNGGNSERTPDVKRVARKPQAPNNMIPMQQQQSPVGVNSSSPPPPPPPPPLAPLSLQTMGI